MRVLGIIPARGGSKGLPGKNIRPLNGFPLIAYSITCCQGSKKLTDFVVSTDSKDIKKIAEDCGAVVLQRPADTAADSAPTELCVQDAVRQLEAQGKSYDALALVQITCPFRLSKDIDDAIEVMEASACSGVMSVSESAAHYHPYWQKKIDDEGRLSSWFQEEGIDADILETQKYWRRQDLPGKSYWKNGAIYVTQTAVMMNENNRYGSDCRALVIDDSRLVNIDTLEDFNEAEERLSQGRITLDFELPQK